jgi:hypothetical protein
MLNLFWQGDLTVTIIPKENNCDRVTTWFDNTEICTFLADCIYAFIKILTIDNDYLYTPQAFCVFSGTKNDVYILRRNSKYLVR